MLLCRARANAGSLRALNIMETAKSQPDAPQGVLIAAANHKNNRRELDYYPTPPDVTFALIDRLNLPKDLTIWEPACGTGMMSRAIQSKGYKVASSDLKDYGFGMHGVDFTKQVFRKGDWIITNPPFNRSEEFIKTAINLKPKGFAFLLKSQYWHAKRRYEIFKQFPPAFVLPLTWRPDFMEGEKGGKPTMEVAWSVWIEGETQTRFDLLKKPDGGI